MRSGKLETAIEPEMKLAQTIVIKVGTGVLTDDQGRLDEPSLVKLVTGMAQISEAGSKCVLVSSGAVGAGVGELGLETYPNQVQIRQACASLGQAALMKTYGQLFSHFGLKVAQLLLTAGDLAVDLRRENARQTLMTLLGFDGVIPIVNENDSVAVEELTFGDNDMLSVRVAELISADLLILMTSVDGLMSGGLGGSLIERVEDIDAVRKNISQSNGRFSIGGMSNKLNAVEVALSSGIETLIANGRKPEQLLELAQGRGVATRFSQPS